MTVEERRRPAVGAQVKRWRTERWMTLANVAERTDLNVGYLSQIENDKASPSLTCLAAIGDALDVPIAWFFMGEVPPPRVVRAAERPRRGAGGTRTGSSTWTAATAATCRSSRGRRRQAGALGLHAHAGDEHHLVLRGRWRMSQGDHVVEVGPGDYLRWDGTDPARRRGHRRRGGPHPDRDPPSRRERGRAGRDPSPRRRPPGTSPAVLGVADLEDGPDEHHARAESEEREAHPEDRPRDGEVVAADELARQVAEVRLVGGLEPVDLRDDVQDRGDHQQDAEQPEGRRSPRPGPG